ncbi:diguanylate cyclase [Siculibacillus lacustris]|uniref:diguanylate cyclase n=1 Tax=Siculibacillus lacustris TaxID=1549641 RepID=A0A4Q9VKK8_9HYPH|nr:diguanylate cyclase [Siculibacillus lacustris]TBW35953.1 diguanylate cyclase [Siculibacillus lacustris]
MRIVLVDPSRIGLKLMTKMLVDGGHCVLPFSDGAAALECLRGDEDIDVLMTSFEIPNVSGLELCWEARLIANGGRPIYVVAMSSSHDRDRLIEALDSGADDFITKPPIATELYARLRAAERMTHAQRELIRLATIDPLTDLPNRREFFERAGAACHRADGSEPLSMVMFDIDHFKAVNDTWGHDSGDVVLRVVAAALRRCPGHPARIGGEEFALLLEGWDLLDAYHEAERLRLALQERPIRLPMGAVAITVSLGVAEHVPGQSVDLLLKNADVALYAAKTSGRNRAIAAQGASYAERRSAEPAHPQTILLAC